VTLLCAKYKWCRNVQDTSEPVPKCLADTSALVQKCLGFLPWCRNVQWTLWHQSQNVLGPKCLRSEVSVHQFPHLTRRTCNTVQFSRINGIYSVVLTTQATEACIKNMSNTKTQWCYETWDKPSKTLSPKTKYKTQYISCCQIFLVFWMADRIFWLLSELAEFIRKEENPAILLLTFKIPSEIQLKCNNNKNTSTEIIL